jgi:nucleotide-binding universal stress UspA family protein
MTKRFMNPKGKILVPVAFDDSAADVLKAAGQIAKRTGLSLSVVHVSEYWVGRSWPTEMMMGGPMGGLVSAIEDESMILASSQLKELVAKNLPGHKVTSEVLLGYPADSIRAHAVTMGAELIILGGTAGDYKFVPRGLSTVLGLMSEAPCPVLVIPKGSKTDWSTTRLHAVMADDLQPESDNAILIGYEWVTALGQVQLTHIHVNQLQKADLKEALSSASAASHAKQGLLDTETVWTAAMKSIQEKLNSRAPGRKTLLESRGGSVETQIIQGDPVDAVLKTAVDRKADLMIFGRHRTWRRKPFAIGQLPFHAMLKSGRPVLIAEG